MGRVRGLSRINGSIEKASRMSMSLFSSLRMGS